MVGPLVGWLLFVVVALGACLLLFVVVLLLVAVVLVVVAVVVVFVFVCWLLLPMIGILANMAVIRYVNTATCLKKKCVTWHHLTCSCSSYSGFYVWSPPPSEKAGNNDNDNNNNDNNKNKNNNNNNNNE